ncbi:MAG TPA: YqaE/Pmp3 family membrane protein [Candidatus Paenalcaligenes intestinipullorum]|uniref:YqaE/Pmp3 family membrane protein n=1 Tax=Candidatus Paenalcaligenes intestinipullorum TaxID=2838718 RepID=A0A9D2RK60_9BURK|nr:YqaE/Pmp3 family membrane protein [Candidatus Paenalcaligenes intestinipullorum]
MLYLLAILLPPVAVLICGKPVQALLNLVLTLFFWIPGVIHAILVVNGRHADQRTERVVNAIRQSNGGR